MESSINALCITLCDIGKGCPACHSASTRNTLVPVLSLYQSCETAMLLADILVACDWPESLLKGSHFKMTLRFTGRLQLFFAFVDQARSVYDRQCKQKVQGSHWSHSWRWLKPAETFLQKSVQQVAISSWAKVWAGLGQRAVRMQKWMYFRVFSPPHHSTLAEKFLPQNRLQETPSHMQNFFSLPLLLSK